MARIKRVVERRRDWVHRFEALRTAIVDEPRAFEWGRHDCCVMAAVFIEAMTGFDALRVFGGYKTRRGAANRLAKWGGIEGAAEEITRRTRWDEIAPNYLRRGDCAVYVSEAGVRALGIIDLTGRHVLVAHSPGLRALEFFADDCACIARAWRVGAS